jgi:putative holliday junction resolvase
LRRVLGVDWGTRRLGLAVSDPTGTLASPHGIVERGDDPDADRRAVVEAARAVDAGRIVVGLPRSLSGREGPSAGAARAEAAALADLAGPDLPVEVHDERFSTVTAEQLTRGTRRRRARRRPVDDAAAAVMLQSYLESRR